MTDLEIFNCALIRVSCEPLAATTGNSKPERLYQNMYAATVQKLLVEHPWNFAIKRVGLTANGNTPNHTFSHEFDLPADFLRLLSVENYDGENSGGRNYDYFYDQFNSCPDYKVENNKILALDEEINIRYLYNVTDATLFSVEFAEALELKLAEKMAYTFTQSNSLRESFAAEYKEKLQDAKSIDAQSGGTPIPFQDQVFLNSRK